LEGLSPATDYVYRFDVDGRGTSESYGFRTAPAPGGQQTRIAMGSCIRDEPAPIFTTIPADAPDVFLYLGDNHYANVNHITSLDDDRLGILRWNYRRALLQPDRALLARTASTLAIWDDHDFLGNNTVGSAPGKAVAKRAFDEYWANSLSGTSGAPGVYSVEHYGDVDFFLLDDRYDRSPESDPGGSMLSAGQMEWLKTELAASTAVFKIVANGSLFSYAGETWKDFPAARQAFFDFLADNQVEGVVLVAGDVHRSLFRSIPRTKGYALPELVSSPLANPGSTCTNDPDATTLGCFATGNYFVTMDVDTTVADPTLTARIRDEGGATLLTWTLLRSELQD
ncbi:MAG: alkaline phosphatase family protein, partial [Myxococcales bacterium]|nr:alkaline phosphatase family protein [Myxococcales bacterium]